MSDDLNDDNQTSSNDEFAFLDNYDPRWGSPWKRRLVWLLGVVFVLFLARVGYLQFMVSSDDPSASCPKRALEVTAEFVDNPMGRNFAMASAVQSCAYHKESRFLSTKEMCQVLQAWGQSMDSEVTCSSDVSYSEGSIKTFEDDGTVAESTRYLWSEMRNVQHRDGIDAFCFNSTDDGRSWGLGTGLALFGLIPIQTASDSCASHRSFKYANDDKAVYEEMPAKRRSGDEAEIVVKKGTSTIQRTEKKSFSETVIDEESGTQTTTTTTTVRGRGGKSETTTTTTTTTISPADSDDR